MRDFTDKDLIKEIDYWRECFITEAPELDEEDKAFHEWIFARLREVLTEEKQVTRSNFASALDEAKDLLCEGYTVRMVDTHPEIQSAFKDYRIYYKK